MAKEKNEQQPPVDPPKDGQGQTPPDGGDPQTPPAPPAPKKAPAGHVLLAAPAGVTAAGVGKAAYSIPKDGVVPVREEHAGTLIKLHGFKKV